MLHGTLQTESGGPVSGPQIYLKIQKEHIKAASVKPDTLLFVKAQLGWSSFAVHFWKNRQERRSEVYPMSRTILNFRG